MENEDYRDVNPFEQPDDEFDLQMRERREKLEAMPKPMQPGEVRVFKTDTGYFARAQAKSGEVFFYVSELTFSRQSIDAVLETQIDPNKPSYIQRIDLRSASAIRALVTDLNNAFGNKKDENGYNWSLILNSMVSELSKKIQQSQTPINLANVAFEEPLFLLTPFLQQDASNLIFASSESGKTWFVQRMCLSLISGKSFLGFHSPSGKKILYLDYEDSPSAFAARIHKLCSGMGLDYKTTVPSLLYYKPSGSFRNNLEIIRRMVVNNAIDLIVIDAGGDAAGGSPSDEEKVLDLFNALEELPITKLMLHHEPKYVQSEAAAFYGSMYWKARSRVAWRLETESEEQDTKILKLTIQKKSNLPPQPTIYLRQTFTGVAIEDVFDGDGNPILLIPSVTIESEDLTARVPKKNIDEMILEELEKEPLTEGQVAQLVGKERSNVGKRLRMLKDKDLIEQKKKGKSILWDVK